jgi:hypothetical protein
MERTIRVSLRLMVSFEASFGHGRNVRVNAVVNVVRVCGSDFSYSQFLFGHFCLYRF